jgi:hypothetical protein
VLEVDLASRIEDGKEELEVDSKSRGEGRDEEKEETNRKKFVKKIFPDFRNSPSGTQKLVNNNKKQKLC